MNGIFYETSCTVIQYQRQSILIKLQYFFLDNLSRKNTTNVTQNSIYESHGPTFAVDGIILTKEDDCSHTDVNHSMAWFQVDLGKQYSIKNVKIYYRREGVYFSLSFLKAV